MVLTKSCFLQTRTFWLKQKRWFHKHSRNTNFMERSHKNHGNLNFYLCPVTIGHCLCSLSDHNITERKAIFQQISIAFSYFCELCWLCLFPLMFFHGTLIGVVLCHSRVLRKNLLLGRPVPQYTQIHCRMPTIDCGARRQQKTD